MGDIDQMRRAKASAELHRVTARGHTLRILLALLVALVTYLAFPATPLIDSPVFEIGSVATENVISPISFRVPKDERELSNERKLAAQSVYPVFGFDSTAVDSSMALLHRFFAAVDTAASVSREPSQQAVSIRTASEELGVRLLAAEGLYLANARQRESLSLSMQTSISRILAQGVVPTGTMDTLRGFVTLRRGDSARVFPADSVVTFPAFLTRARMPQPGMESSVADGLLVKLLTSFFRPTLVADREGTEALRLQASDSVVLHKFEVREQEAIVREYQLVGATEHERLLALRAELQTRHVGQRNFGRLAGAVVFNMLLVGLFGFAVFKLRPPLYGSMRSLIAMSAVMSLVIVAASFIARAPGVRPELVPVAVLAITFSVLFDSRISIIATMMLAVLIGGQAAFADTNAHFLNMVAGVAAVFSVRLMHQRNQAYYSMLAISSAYALGALAIGLMMDSSAVAILESALYGAVNSIITVPFAMLLLPLAEEFTGIDTYPRLLEWSDLNRPLMRQLSLEAPGTYAHTMMIANLSEAACNAIGANGMLARVGAYYHDIGKLKAPLFFVENQARGRNPHDQLPPDQSAAIIRNHVPEGLQLAAKHKLPRTLAAFISEHHGTGPITYFLDKSTELHGPPLNPEEYRYPGPIPQSAETAIVMLADAVEASARVLNEPSPQKLREVVDHLVALRMEQGQLADTPLTLREIDSIKHEFVRVLGGSHHARIDYPESAGGISAGFGS